MKCLLPLAAVCLCLAAPTLAQTAAPVPPTLNFQGRLAKPDGTPVPDTNAQTITFSLYDAATGGNLLWTQTTPNVSVHNGVFATKLNFAAGFQGAFTFNGTFANPLLTPYLQIQVGTAAPLAPRQPFASTPYAFIAGTVPDGSLTASKFAGGVLAPGGAAGGDLAGTYPNPALATLFTSLGKVSGGLLTAVPNGAAALDQSQTKTGNTVAVLSAAAKMWQSFTPAVTGNLTAVTLYIGSANFNTQHLSLFVYSGEGVGGSLLTYANITTTAAAGFQTFPLAQTTPLVAGQRYTLALLGTNYLWSGSAGNPYANGDAYAPSGVPADFDFAFQTTMQPTSSLVASAPLFLNGGGNIALFAQATPANDVSAAIVGINTGGAGSAILGTATGDGIAVGGVSYGVGNAVNAQANGDGNAVRAISNGAGNGVSAISNGSGNAVFATANGVGDAVRASAIGSGYAGNFAGPVRVFGNVTVSGTVTANSFSVNSDARYKTHIHTLDNALADVLNLRGVSYEMDRERWPAKNFPAGRQIGFIAQEMEKIFPELVLTDSEGYKSVLYQNAVPILVEAIKAQEKRIKALEDANAELKKQNAAIAELAREIAELKKEKRP